MLSDCWGLHLFISWHIFLLSGFIPVQYRPIWTSMHTNSCDFTSFSFRKVPDGAHMPSVIHHLGARNWPRKWNIPVARVWKGFMLGPKARSSVCPTKTTVDWGEGRESCLKKTVFIRKKMKIRVRKTKPVGIYHSVLYVFFSVLPPWFRCEWIWSFVSIR